MEMTGPYPHGTPSWVDLMTTDADTAAAFYRALFGWEVAVPGGEEVGGYTMFRVRDRDVAAFAPTAEDGPAAGVSSVWQTYVAVDDVEDRAARVEPAGGTLLAPPMDVMDFGRMAVIADPSGATFQLWQARTHIGCGIVNEPGTLVWNELATREPDAAEAFYGAVLGWTFEDSMSLEGGATYRLVRRPGDGAVVAGLVPMAGDAWPPEPPAHWMVYFAVDDVDATASLARSLGGTVRVPPSDIAVGRFAVLADPAGAVFSIIRMAEVPAG